MSREVPEGWTDATIDQVADVNPETVPANTAADFLLRYIDVATVAGPSTMNEPRSIAFCEAPSRARRKVAQGDILVSTVRPYLRAFCKVSLKAQNLVASTAFAVLRPQVNADRDFLYQHILSDRFVEHLTPRMKGSNYPAVTAADVGAYAFHLPPLPEQRRIAEVLSSVDEAIAATRALIEQTRKVKQAVLERLLTKGIGHTRFKQTKIGEIPEGWEVRALGELAEFVNGRGFKPHEWAHEGLPIIRIQNLNGSNYYNYFSGDFHTKLVVEPGSLLFAWSGSRGTSFGPHIWKGPRGLLNYHTWRVSLRSPDDRDFLYYALLFITKKIENDSHGASALVHMQKSYIVDYLIPFPPANERSQISATLSQSESLIDLQTAQLERLTELKTALMSDLLTGRKRVTDALPLAAE